MSLTYNHRMSMIDIKEKADYAVWLICFLLGVRVSPVWFDEIITGCIGVIFLVIGGVIMFFVRKYLETRYKDVFKRKGKIKE